MLLRVGDDRVLGLHGQRFPGSVVYDLRGKDGRDVPFLNGLDDEPPPPADVVARRFQMVRGAAMGVRGIERIFSERGSLGFLPPSRCFQVLLYVGV